MRSWKWLSLLCICCCVVALGQTKSTQNVKSTPKSSGGSSQLRGVYVEDIDKKADPCTDFFEYANGAWRAKNPIPASQSRWSRRWASGEMAKDQLHGILEEVSKRKDWPQGSIQQLTGDYYGACMEESRINQQGFAPIKPMLAEIDQIKDTNGVLATIRRFQDLGISVPFGLTSTPNQHNPVETIADVYASGISMPDRDYYLKQEPRFKEAREKYRAHVAAMFKLIGYNDADAKSAGDTVLNMETKLAENSLDNIALREPSNTDHITTFAALEQMAPKFDWRGYFEGAHIGQGDLNVQEPKFLAEVNRQITETSLPEWKTYLKWHLVHTAAGSLSDPFVTENFNFYSAYLQGSKEMKPRWKRCVESTDQWLGEASGKLYTDKYFPPESKARMQAMVKNLLATMGDVIQGLDWMGSDTKKKAMEKLSTFNPKIGYPDKWKDYSSVKVTRDNYWADVVNARKWNVDDDRIQIGKATDRGRWGMTPPTSDAYYNPLLNEIVFPAGVLVPPAFDPNATDAVNYGAIGVVIGHEISHGFDDSGAQFDAQGRLKDWWTADDLKKFKERGQCVVDQFDSYFIEPGIHHQGKLVLGESIGDLAGARIAYLAYKKSREGKGPEPTINGFNPDQQFFIAWGQFRGDEIRPETQRLMVQSDPHPIAKYRVIGPLSNSPDFAKTFQCKPGSPMVRPADKRCQVW